MSEQASPRATSTMKKVVIGIAALGILVWLMTMLYGSEEDTAVNDCRDAAESLYQTEASFTEVTVVREDAEGWFVQGTVNSYRGGTEQVDTHWHCRDGQLTFTSPAG